MRKISILAAAAFALSAATAFAQAPADSPPPPPKAPPEIMPGNPPPPPGPRGPDGPGPKDEWRMRQTTDRPPPPPPRERAAHFHIEDGNTRIDLRCADGESTKACGDVVLQILDRLNSSKSDDNEGDRNGRDRGDYRYRYDRR